VAVGAVLVLRAVLLAGAPHDVDASKEIGRPTDPA
jgi:hypothetical protein